MRQTFDNNHRLVDDSCAKTAREFQNDYFNNYNVFNFYPTNSLECADAKKQIDDFTTDNHVNMMDGYGTVNQCNIDTDSKLRNGVTWSHDHRSKRQLSSRIFKDIPDLSKGSFVPNIESKLVQGEDTSTRKSCNVLSEKSLFGHHMIPLVDCLKNTIQDPAHIIMDNWGGISTRDSVRQEDFLKEQGYILDNDVWKKKISSLN
jgi:hypothetical protein